MGASYSAICTCGYEGDATVASGWREAGKVFKFPYACDQCKAVVNIDVLSGDLSCPVCRSTSLKSYNTPIEKPTWDLTPKKWPGVYEHFSVPTTEDGVCRLTEDGLCQVTDYGLYQGLNYCPSCKEIGLTFSPSVLFD